MRLGVGVAPALVAIFLVACASGGGGRRAEPAVQPMPRLGDDWFEFRAESLGITVEQARARDAALPEDRPPTDALDAHTAAEAEAIWRDVCARCHGLDGTPPENATFTRRPRAWGGMGASMGFLFGGDRMRAAVYRTIKLGGREKDGVPSQMPPFGPMFSREQLWALVKHLEQF